MANESVGSAYLSVQFKTDDSAAKGLEKTLEKAGEAGGKAGGEKGGKALGSGLESAVSTKSVVIGNLIANAVISAASKAAEALGDVLQTAFDGFARFEQLEGGIDILFGANAGEVLANAQQAFQTAGMSANEYMTSVTGFSSALINSLGGDTAEAARLANMAIVDMSDNVNTFGTDIDMVQRAYQGFARGNFTMLDNLSLGFAGTKEGMQQLLERAEEFSGIHYDIESYADIVQAINVVQERMGVMGKTAAEAAGTVEGSLASLNAAWANWLTELGKSDGDIEASTGALVEAFGNAAQNVVPLVGRIIGGLISGLPQVVAQAAAALPDVLASIFAAVFGEGVGEGVAQAFEDFGAMLAPLGEAFAQVGAFAGEAFGELSGLLAELVPLMQPLFDVVAQLAAVFVEQVLPFVVSVIGSGLVGFISGVIGAVAGLLAGVGQLLAFVQGVPAAIMGAFSSLQATLTGVFTGAASAIQGVFESVVNYFASVPSRIVGFFSGIGSAISNMFSYIKLPHFKFSGSLNPLDWPGGGLPSISVEWYKRGGIIDGASLIGVGEAGPEAVVPLTPGRLQPFGEAVAQAMAGGGTTNVYINGAKVNSNEAIEESFYTFMRQLSRLNQMGGVVVG